MSIEWLLAQVRLSDPSPLRDFVQGKFITPEGSIWFEVLVVTVASIAIGGLIFLLFSILLRSRPHYRNLLKASSHGHGISRSSVLLFATLVYEAIARALLLNELLESQAHQWIIFVRILALGWLASVAYQASLTVAETRGAIRGEKQKKILVPFARKLGSVLILMVAAVTALAVVGTNVWGMVAGLGITGIAIAFAAKDSVENVFGSFTVLLDMPFGVGDWIRIGPVEGIVEEINLRSTRIRTFDDSLITMPNSNFIKASVENLGQRRSRRVKTTIQFDTPESPESMEAFCTALLEFTRSMPEVQPESVQVSLFELKETGAVVQFVARFSVDSYSEELVCRQRVLLASIRLAAEHQLHIKSQPVPITP